MLKWILILHLLNPTTNVESMKFVIVDTNKQCTAMQSYVKSPAYKERSKRHASHDHLVVTDAKCDEIDLSKYKR